MKITNAISFIFISLVLLLACNDKDDPDPVQLLDNPSVEDGSQTPISWFKTTEATLRSGQMMRQLTGTNR